MQILVSGSITKAENNMIHESNNSDLNDSNILRGRCPVLGFPIWNV